MTSQQNVREEVTVPICTVAINPCSGGVDAVSSAYSLAHRYRRGLVFPDPCKVSIAVHSKQAILW